jgi:hypothetical protein
MFKKSFGLIATAALVLAPMAAFAQESQVSSQGAGNSGVASGSGNLLIQNQDQTSDQSQLGVDGYYHGSDPQIQVNKQAGVNSGAAIGDGNVNVQNIDQLSNQIQTDVGH